VELLVDLYKLIRKTTVIMRKKMTTVYAESIEQEERIDYHPDGTATVYKRSMLTGIMHKAWLPISPDHIIAWKQQHRLVQDVFPDLDRGQREFLMTGCTPEEWDTEFKDEKENEDAGEN
jgi:hypothetical protein